MIRLRQLSQKRMTLAYLSRNAVIVGFDDVYSLFVFSTFLERICECLCDSVVCWPGQKSLELLLPIFAKKDLEILSGSN